MDKQSSRGAVEAILFASGEPIEATKIAEAAELDKKQVLALLDELRDDLDERAAGICLLCYGDRYQLATRPAYGDAVNRMLDNRRNTPLSTAAMEVLALVAYNQPVSRSFIDQVRGVDSSSSISTLLEKNLICEAGRLDLPGRPVSFATTDNFLRCFGLSELSELPSVHGFEEEPAMD